MFSPKDTPTSGPFLRGVSTMAPPSGAPPQLEVQPTSVQGLSAPKLGQTYPGPASTAATPGPDVLLLERYQQKLATLKACGFPGTEAELAKLAWDTANSQVSSMS